MRKHTFLLATLALSCAGCRHESFQRSKGTISFSSEGSSTGLGDGRSEIAPQSASVKIDATYEVFQTDSENFIFRFTPAKSQFVGSAFGAKGEAEGRFNTAPKFLVAAKIGADGRVFQFWSDTELNQLQLLLPRTFFSLWRASVPHSGIAQESEIDGDYKVEYFAMGNGLWIRRWKELTPKAEKLMQMSSRRALTTTDQIDGEAKYTFDSSNRLRNASSTRTRSTSFGGKVVSRSTESAQIDEEILQDLQLEMPAKKIIHATTSPTDEVAMELQIQRKELGSETLASLIKQISPNLAEKTKTRHFLKLRALFYLKQEASLEALGLLRTLAPASLTFRILVEALSATGNEPSQQALLALLRARESEVTVLTTVLPQLVGVPKLIPALRDYLLGWTQATAMSRNRDVHFLAQLVAGSLAGDLIRSDQESAGILATSLFRSLEVAPRLSADSINEQVNLLYALGNIGREEVMNKVNPFLRSPDSRVRAAAVHSLRNIPRSTTQRRLDELKQTEQDSGVLREIESILRTSAPDK